MSIHPTAIVDRKAELDDAVEVGPYCVIDAHVRVAAGCRLHQRVYLTGWTELGENCEVHPGAIVGHSPQDVKYAGERSYCRIGQGTVLREYVTIHRGTHPESATILGENCFLLAGSHVAHNCELGNGVTLINNVLLAGHVHIDDRATLGGAAGVHQFVRIGELAMIGGTARVTMDVVPFAMFGPKERVVGLNRIGLQRANLPREDVRQIREAFRTLFGRGLPFREAARMVAETEDKTPSLDKLVRFLQAESKRGIAGGARRRPINKTDDVDET